MKYIFLIVIIFLLPACSDYYEEEEYNYIPDNSLRFIRAENETSILINKSDTYYLLLINNQNIELEVDYLIKVKDIQTNIEYEEEFLLHDELSINDVTFKLNNKLEIELNNQNICIYTTER